MSVTCCAAFCAAAYWAPGGALALCRVLLLHLNFQHFVSLQQRLLHISPHSRVGALTNFIMRFNQRLPGFNIPAAAAACSAFGARRSHRGAMLTFHRRFAGAAVMRHTAPYVTVCTDTACTASGTILVGPQVQRTCMPLYHSRFCLALHLDFGNMRQR